MTEERKTDDIREKLAGSIRSLKAHLSKYRGFTEKIQEDPRKAAEYVERLQALTDEQEDLIKRVGEDVFNWIQDGGDLKLVEDDGTQVRPEDVETTVAPDEASKDSDSGADAADGPGPETGSRSQQPTPRPQSRHSRSQAADTADTLSDAEKEERFESIVDDLGSPPDQLDALPDVSEEVAVLREVVETREDWPALPDDKQRQLIGYVVARARRVQDEVAGSLKFDSAEDKLGDVFRVLTKYSKIEKPGFVHGLARSHEPQTGSWLDDAQRIWDVQIAE